MVKTVLSSLFAVFLFALGAAGSWYFVQWQEKQKELEQQTEDVTAEVATEAPADPSVPNATPSPANSEPMAVPVRSGPMSAEQIVRTASLYRQQVEQLAKREAEVQSQETRLRLAQSDLNQRKQEIEGILKQIQGYAEQAERTLNEIKAEREVLRQEQLQKKQQAEQSEDSAGMPDEAQLKNLQKTATLFRGVNPEAAAEIIREFAKQGKMGYVARMLDQMEERDASKILDAIGADTAIATQLMEELQNLKPEVTAAAPNKAR